MWPPGWRVVPLTLLRDNPGLSAVCARDDLAVDRDRDHLLIDDTPLWAALA